MSWVILALLVIGAIFMALGVYVDNTGRSADERLGAVIPWFIGATILAIDGVLLIAFVIYKAFVS